MPVGFHVRYSPAYFDGWMHLFTGTHWEKIDDFELKIFLKFAYAKLCGDNVSASRKELVNGFAS